MFNYLFRRRHIIADYFARSCRSAVTDAAIQDGKLDGVSEKAEATAPSQPLRHVSRSAEHGNSRKSTPRNFQVTTNEYRKIEV